MEGNNNSHNSKIGQFWNSRCQEILLSHEKFTLQTDNQGNEWRTYRGILKNEKQ